MPYTPDPQQISAVILAGGRASRMGGEDKGLLPLRGRPMVSHVIERLSVFDRLLISANRNLEAYAAFGLPVIRDPLADFPGPLAGILAALEAIDTPYLLTAPCDTPLLPETYVARMLAEIDQAPGQAAVASDGQWLQPVFCLLPKSVSPDLRAYLEGGERRASAWLRRIGAHEVDFSDYPDMFVNINTPTELNALEQDWKEAGQ